MKDKILILAADLEQVLPIAKSLYDKGFEIHGIFLLNLVMDMALDILKENIYIKML